MKRNRKDEVIEALLKGGMVSGVAISELLGISRVMVNRYIKELQREGFGIEVRRHVGYRLYNVPDVIYPSLLKLKDLRYNFLVFDALSSTNTYCLRNSDSLKDRTVVIAREQTQGRGRFGRNWYSERDKDVTMSIFLKLGVPFDKVIRYTISVSLAVLDAVRDFDIDEVFIKWPNDIYWRNKKLCGILAETLLQCDTGIVDVLVLGVGLNVNSSPSKVLPWAVSMYEILGFEVKRSAIIRKILINFESNISQPYDSVFERWRASMGFVGKRVVLVSGDERIECRFIDVSKSGEIIVEENGTIRKFGFGEVSLVVE